MSFAAIMARRHATASAAFQRDASGGLLYLWLPAVPGRSAVSFPSAVAVDEGTVKTQDTDLTGLVNRAVRGLAVSCATLNLPSAYRAHNKDLFKADHICKVGRTFATAISYRVVSSSSADGLTEIQLAAIT